MPIYAEKDTRYAHFAEMRQSHRPIRKKKTYLVVLLSPVATDGSVRT